MIFSRAFLFVKTMIETERLQLIACNKMHFETLLKSEQDFADLLDAKLADDWLAFPESVPFAQKMLADNPQILRWGMYVFLYKPENTIIGTGGYKGIADENGMVEIGYAVASGFQNRGIATEAALAMIKNAFSYSFVNMVDAHTLAEENASVKVLQKCGMRKIGEKSDPEDGQIWHWRVLREEFKVLETKDT